MSNNKVSIVYSWPIIILALVIFWPIGLLLVIRKISIDKKAAMLSEKLIKIIGFASCAFAAIGFLVSIGDGLDGADVGMIFFFAAAGVALLCLAQKIKKEAANIKRYLAIIVNNGEKHLDAIAVATGKTYNVVKNDIQKMIDKNFLKNAYIDENAGEVVLAKKATPNVAPIPQAQAATIATTAPAAEVRIVACPCCGANNTISSAVGECEYCGAPLK